MATCEDKDLDNSLPLEIAEACEGFHLSLSNIESLLQGDLYDAVESAKDDKEVRYSIMRWLDLF